MTTTAKVILDSTYKDSRITTMQLRYPRLIHSEFMTHRVFSRNASSSRAIPVEKMLRQVREEPAMPIHWGKNQSGMQAREEVDNIVEAKTLWLAAAKEAASIAATMMEMGLHKQVVNRILEPFQYISVIVTSTEWDNFFALRDHPDADPNIADLARKMRVVYDDSQPQALTRGTYHLPYITAFEWEEYASGKCGIDALIKCSVARCARVSYMTHDGDLPNMDKDIALYERLAFAEPPHLSPLEHQATPRPYYEHPYSGNFSDNWAQFRKYFEADCVEEFWDQ